MNKNLTLIFKINSLKPIPNYRATTPFCVYNYLKTPIFGLTYSYFYKMLLLVFLSFSGTVNAGRY